MSDRPQILVAAADKMVADLLGYLIEVTCGCSAIIAPNGEEAVRLALERRPTAVVLDVEMPGIGATEAARTLRAWLQDSVPLLIAIAHPGSQARAHEACVFDHVLGKPVEIEVLMTLLDKQRLVAKLVPLGRACR